MSKTDAILLFANLHLSTCGNAPTVSVDGDGVTMRQRCTCGEEMSVTLELHQVEAVKHVVKNYVRVDDRMKRLRNSITN
jgi:hypothetical protein